MSRAPSATVPPAMPAPRRVRMGPTAWMLVREQVLDDPAATHPDRLPQLPTSDTDTTAARDALIHHGVLTDTGELAPPVRAGLGVLATAPVTVVVERRTATMSLDASWATVGLPTAGLAVTHRTVDTGTDAAARTDIEVELQLLAVDHLVDTVVAALAIPDTVHPDTAGPDTAHHTDLLDAATPGSLPPPLDRVVVDGHPILQARVQVSGPAGTSLATILGDGEQAWQPGARDRTSLVWRPVTAAGIRESLTTRLADQLHRLEGPRGA